MDQYSEIDVKNALAPYHTMIRKAIVTGFAEWLAVQECRSKNGFPPVLYARTVSNYVFDAIARAARLAFASDRTVHILDEAQTVKFCFGNVVVGRFKKGDDDYMGQNIPTQAALDFVYAQQALPGFPPEAAKVEFIWSANDLGTEIESVMVVARDGDLQLWSYEIDDVEEVGKVIEFPAPSGPLSDDDEPLVKLKAVPKNDAEGE